MDRTEKGRNMHWEKIQEGHWDQKISHARSNDLDTFHYSILLLATEHRTYMALVS